jgi:uncharacterized protein with von Willebrand factor type A (vWA) domain
MAVQDPTTGQEQDTANARANPPGDHPGRRSKLVPEHLIHFLEYLRQNGNVSLSSRMIGWSRSTVYAFAGENPSFKEAMREAVTEGRELLIGEAWKRATTWTTFKAEGSKETQVKPPSDRLLAVLIQGYFPEFKASHIETPTGEELLPETADLTQLDDDELDALERILTKVGGDLNVVSSGEG